MTIGERIRAERKARGWAQRQIATATGYTIAYISDIERGRQNGSVEAVLRIAGAFSITPSDLFQGVAAKGGSP